MGSVQGGAAAIYELGDVQRIASQIIKPLKNNFVERPWGGTRIREFKGLCPLPEQPLIGGSGIGESFEIAAFDGDSEAREFPSKVRLSDGSIVPLPRLLERHGELLLGKDFVARHEGRHYPLLPKFLDIQELLSVQGHPEGNTEVYVIVDAEPGATIRLGFREDVEVDTFRAELAAGRINQQSLLALFPPGAEDSAIQQVLGAWFAAKENSVNDVLTSLREVDCEPERAREATELLSDLKLLYWQVLDMMNEIEVVPGQVIHNANPQRIVAMTGKAPTAEVHALGNPEGREVVALEIRRPGPTFRAWDNVRFPLRDIDIDAALNVLNLRKTDQRDFLVEREPIPGRAGTSVSVDSEAFRLEHLSPESGLAVEVPAESVHCLHALAGHVRLVNADDEEIGTLERGESAIVPKTIGAYRVLTESGGTAEVVKVSLPQ